ncbi:DUF4625 domain-containing protein [Capnocytophaga sp. ARDL2]|uniref:DUF4625 domain-containing protein n=1 Tax=Capnocytophaga sp. ARDL2 TaxID=3238809 RepID=UPI003555D547
MKKFSVFVAMALTFVACKEDEGTVDIVKPMIEWVTPVEDQEVVPGTNFEVKAAVADNVELASYKIEVHNADDGHQHRRALATPVFEYEYEGTLSGILQEITHTVAVPAEVKEGHYHVGLFVLDKAGNQSQKFVEIFIGEEGHEH